MKQEVFLLAIAISLVTAAGAVVNEDGSSPSSNTDEGEMAITSTGSAGATTSVGPNGTEWSSEFSTAGSQCLSGNSTGVTNSSFETSGDTYSVSFEGMVETANPCHTLEHEITETDSGHYTMNITSEAENGTCVQCVGGVNYQASFQTGEPFTLEVRHDGEEVEELEHPENENEEPSDTESQEKGFVEGIVSWFRNLL